jgi:hypothetical protein
MSFRSPNRSILDESDDVLDDDNNTDEENQMPLDTDRILDDSDCMNSSFMREDGPVVDDHDAMDISELEQYKAALSRANVTIQQLHSSLQKFSGEYTEGMPPLIDLSTDQTIPIVSRPTNSSPGYQEECTVNVRMLDGENFVTDWDVLTPQLTCPPDHDLRSPIVAAVLDLWTNDRKLQESLLDWIEQVLAGNDPDSIPPLTLNSLDHQARDAFVLHIFPLLLRRPDILLDIQARVHRRTTYDLAVSVDHTIHPNQSPFVSHAHRQYETTSIRSDVGSYGTSSSAVTDHISNTSRTALRIPTRDGFGDYDVEGITHPGRTMSRLSYDEMTEDIVPTDNAQPGLISTLGGALGGLLLSRGRTVAGGTAPPSPTRPVTQASSSDHASLRLPPSLHHRPMMMAAIMGNRNMPTILESPTTTMMQITTGNNNNNSNSNSNNGTNEKVVDFVEVDGDNDDVDQPYHRVVSAPPGRIGVTFVEYRGHCMVSDVYPDSPLIGWIFPSDVLIAIDDLPVSGMRIRDIIKVLKDRSNVQRALRVVSSHAMNELTLNASMVVNDETG